MNLGEYFKEIMFKFPKKRSDKVENQIINETIYPETIEEIKSAIKLHEDTEVGFVQRSSGYLGNNLFAMQDVGNKRKNQEDAVLLDKHEEIPQFSIMVVADRNGRRRKW